MKKFTLTLAAALLAVTSAFSQTAASLQPLTSFSPKALAQQPLQQLQLPVARNAHRAPLFEQPAGKLFDQVVASYGGYGRNWLYGLMDVSTDGGMGKIVEGDDGNIYIYNLPTYVNCESWVKCERAEGDTIVIKKQMIDQREGSEAVYDYYITRVVWQWTDEAAGEGVFVEEEGDIKLLYNNGELRSTDENKDPFQEGSYAIGCVYTTDGTTFTWEGATNWNLFYQPLTEGLVELPEGAELETITVSYKNVNGNSAAEQVKVAFVGNEVYLNVYQQGVYIKGTIEGDKLTFKSGQYVGNYAGQYYLFFVGERYYTIHDDATDQDVQAAELLDALVFDYDAEKRSFKTDDVLVINVGKNTTHLYLTALVAPYFYFYEEVPATPADPVVTNYNATLSQWGYNALQFTISATDVDGNFIVPEKLTWRAWIDDEPFIFSPDDYEDLTEEMEEIPYGFSLPSFDIYTSFYTFYFEPAKNVGIQTIYRGGGEERRSNIVYFDLATSQIVKEVDEEFIVTSVHETPAQAKAVSTVYHDAAGRLVKADAKGFVVKTVTLADGTTRSFKQIRK